MRRRTTALLSTLVFLGCAAPPPGSAPRPAAARSAGPRAATPSPGAPAADGSAVPGASASPAGPGPSAPAATTSAPAVQPSAPNGPSAAPSPRAPSAAPTFAVRPLTRFQAMYDYDTVRNYVPGAVYAGPVHLNRGPVDEAAARVDAKTAGRTTMNVMSNAVGFAPVDGRFYPRFDGPVSLSYREGVDQAPDAAPGTPGAWFRVWARAGEEVAEIAAETLAGIFTHPANARGLGDRPGPMLVPDEVPLPPRLAERLGPVMGLPAGVAAADRSWFRDLPDGVFVPTGAMATGAADAYEPGAVPAGGIYVRGTVEVMRAAVVGDASYYLLQVGLPGSAARRVYGLRADRRTRTLALLARPAGTRLAAELAAVGDDPAALFALPAANAFDLAAWGVAGDRAIAMRFGARPDAPFNGMIAVDLAAADPLRDPADRGRMLPATADRRPLTGHVLALGDPRRSPKAPLAGASAELIGELRGAEVFSTDPVDGGTTTGLTILAAGEIFVQNHLVVHGLADAAGSRTTANVVEALAEAGPAVRAAKDRLALIADRAVVFGLAAPSGADAASTGLVVMASLIGLQDPGEAIALRRGEAYPAAENALEAAFQGSIQTEGVTTVYNRPELHEIGTGDPPELPANGGFGDATEVLNPIYAAEGGEVAGAYPDGTRGRLVIFGTIAGAKRGILGAGDRSYEPRHLFDPRLAELPPPGID